MADLTKAPITHGDEKLVKVYAFIPKDCTVEKLIAVRFVGPGGQTLERVDCFVHCTVHEFGPQDDHQL